MAFDAAVDVMIVPSSVPSIDAFGVVGCWICGVPGETLHDDLRDQWMGVPGAWSLMRCGVCGLVWINPQPRRDQLHRLYSPDYYTHSTPPEESTPSGVVKRVATQSLNPGASPGGSIERLAAAGLRRVWPLREVAAGTHMWLGSTPPGRLLDVGCGDGSFLARMRDAGWRVQGVEPDSTAASIARERHSLDVVCAAVDEAALPEDTFDVVTMSHVVEHVVDPVALLKECRRALRPGGQLVVTTPNIRSLGRAWFGRSWLGWDVPRHLYVFSPKTLRVCARRADLRVEELRTSARRAFYGTLDIRSLRRTPKAGSSVSLRRLGALTFWLVESVANLAYPCGEEILLRARRPE